MLKKRRCHLTAALLCLSTTTWACSGPKPLSQLRHEFGHVQRSQRSAPLTDCTQMMRSTSPKLIDDYLRKIAESLAAANPQVFRGELNLDKFCFQLDESDSFTNRTPNAWADPQSGYIMINKLLLLYAESDAAVAAVMAHELAHVTMEHGSGELHEDLLNNAEFMQLYRLSQAILNGKAEAPQGEDYASIVARQTQLATEILGGEGALNNADEQQADEVGFELYVKAGFDPDVYTWVHTLSIDEDNPLPECPLEPTPRGNKTHPHRCWRLRNILETEMHRHQASYAPLLKRTRMLFPGELVRVKNKIQQIEFEQDPTRWTDF